jgi:hypothetical protein
MLRYSMALTLTLRISLFEQLFYGILIY